MSNQWKIDLFVSELWTFSVNVGIDNDITNNWFWQISIIRGKDQYTWFKHILFMTEHDKGLGRVDCEHT